VKQFFIQKNFRKSRKKFSKTKKKNKFFSGKVKKQQTKKTQTNHSTFLGLSATKFLLAAATKHTNQPLGLLQTTVLSLKTSTTISEKFLKYFAKLQQFARQPKNKTTNLCNIPKQM